ncbi:hypothetical protein D3C87_1697490 [compost metagenome]
MKIHCHISVMATTEQMVGRKNISRKKFLPLIFWFSKRAINKDTAIPIGTPSAA